MEKEAWWATDYELAKSQIQLSDHYTHTHNHGSDLQSPLLYYVP